MLGIKKEKNFTILNLPDNYTIEIGQSTQELNLNDESIDMSHGSICYDTSLDEIIVKDNNSKHGTQILI
jgi:hypothetical protein